MQSIFTPLSVLLPISFDRAAFSSLQNKAKISDAMGQLAGDVGRLEKHASTQDRAFQFVAKSLERDARRLAALYEQGRFDEARFTLQNMTENCIACHSSLPAARSYPGAASFFASVDQAKLEPLDRAKLQVMSRQFDAALDSYEGVFRSKELDPAVIVILGSFTDYLRVAIGVKLDARRPQAILTYLIVRPSTPPHIRQQLNRWLETLQSIDASHTMYSEGLAGPKALIAQAHKLMEFPRDRDGLIQYVAAQGLLSRFVHAHHDSDPGVAEAYYLLGITEGLLEHSIWLSRSDFYFETAIRLSPKAPFAQKAYAMLEENLTVANSGSSGTHLDDEAKALLKELSQMVNQPVSKKSP